MLSRAETKRLQTLARAKGRAESGLFLAEGVRVVEDLLASAVVPRTALVTSSLEDTPRGAALARALRSRVRTLDVSGSELAAIAGTETPQGVVVVAEIPHHDLNDLELEPRAPVVLVDGVQDPGNFGTIVRSADAFGAAFIATLPGTVDPWNPKAVRAAAGSSLRVPIVATSLDALLARLRAEGVTLLGADADGEPVDRAVVPSRVALVLGNEGAGLSAAVRAACDGLVAVPIRGAAESLNVGVAAGILLYVLTRE
jgi:RNA methyltransferase, TrmH family